MPHLHAAHNLHHRAQRSAPDSSLWTKRRMRAGSPRLYSPRRSERCDRNG